MNKKNHVVKPGLLFLLGGLVFHLGCSNFETNTIYQGNDLDFEVYDQTSDFQIYDGSSHNNNYFETINTNQTASKETEIIPEELRVDPQPRSLLPEEVAFLDIQQEPEEPELNWTCLDSSEFNEFSLYRDVYILPGEYSTKGCPPDYYAPILYTYNGEVDDPIFFEDKDKKGSVPSTPASKTSKKDAVSKGSDKKSHDKTVASKEDDSKKVADKPKISPIIEAKEKVLLAANDPALKPKPVETKKEDVKDESKPVIVDKKIVIKKPAQPLNCEDCADSEKANILGSIEDLRSQIEELNNKISDLETSQESFTDEIESLSNQPSEDLLAKHNFLLVGTGYTFFTAPEHFLNNTFGTVIDPVFLYRFGDNFLFEMKFDITLTDCSTNIALVYATADYIVNDCLTVRVGKFSLPLGLVWEKMTTGWINKLPNLPIPYDPRAAALIPPADVGVDLRGAFPIWWWGYCGCECPESIPTVIVWDLWVGNGPDQTNDTISLLGCNYVDNNNHKAYGARIAIRPKPFREVGFSFMRARWNDNFFSANFITGRHLYYTAGVVDLNWALTKHSKLMGEYIYTNRGDVTRPLLGILDDRIIQTGWWLEWSSYLSCLKCCIRPVCCCDEEKESIFDKLEVVVRYSDVDSDVVGLSRSRWSFGLNYHIENILILKAAYDINRNFIGGNRAWLQLAYAF